MIALTEVLRCYCPDCRVFQWSQSKMDLMACMHCGKRFEETEMRWGRLGVAFFYEEEPGGLGQQVVQPRVLPPPSLPSEPPGTVMHRQVVPKGAQLEEDTDRIRPAKTDE